MAALPLMGGPDLRVFVIQGSIRGYVKDTNVAEMSRAST